MSATIQEISQEILVVDDTEINRNLLRVILEKAGYKVVECASGEECLEYCKRKIPLTILLDIMMPGISGLDVCQNLRVQYGQEELPIILVSALTESADVKKGLDTGANDYVTKPVDRGVLLARLKNQLFLAQSYRKIAEQQKTIEKDLKIQQATGDALDQAILVHNQKGEILYCNKVFIEYCNGMSLTSAEVGLNAIFDQRLKDIHAEFMQKINKDPGTVIVHEFSDRKRNWLNVQIVSRPVDFNSTKDVCRVWVWRDLSHMRELERQMSEKIKMETVSIFAMGVAHNFNNLLAAILGASEKLAKTSSNNAMAERCLKIIKKAVDNGSALTKKMSGMGKRVSSLTGPQTVELKPVIDSIIEVHSLHNINSIDFVCDLRIANTNLNVEYLNLLDILSHVIGNAVDAVRENGEVSVNVRESSKLGYVDILIRDNGCGMSPEVQARVFEPFFSTKNLDAKNGVSMVGNGLGLWNVYNLVKLFNGDVNISSNLGLGTEIVLTLPGEILEAVAKDQESLSLQ